MKQYVECINDRTASGYHINYVYKGEIYPLVEEWEFGYRIEVDGPLDGMDDFKKEYFRLIPDEEIHEMEIRKEIYG